MILSGSLPAYVTIQIKLVINYSKKSGEPYIEPRWKPQVALLQSEDTVT